jgi:hypothetical protein
MLNFEFTKCLTARVAVLCLTATLTGTSAAAQQLKMGPFEYPMDAAAEAPLISPEDITISYVDAETLEGDDQSKTSGYVPATNPDVFWAHGNSGILEPGPQFSMKTYGWGAVITKTATELTAPTYHAWVHYSVPTPRRIDYKNARLRRILLSFKTEGAITGVDVWDGTRKILALTSAQLGDHLGTTASNKIVAIDFESAPSVLQGLGVSLKLRGCAYDTNDCPTSVTHIAAVGAEFSR